MLNTHRLSKTAAAVSAVLASMSVCAAQALPEMGMDIRVDTDLTQLDLTQSAYAAKNIAFRMEGRNVTLDPKDGSLTFDSNRRGICVYSAKDPKVPSHLVIGTNSTQDVTVNVRTNNNKNSDSAGIVILRTHVDADGKQTSANAVGVPSVEINGKNLTVNVHNEGTGEVRGINVQNNTTTSDEFASLVINSKNTVINVTGKGKTVGLSAMSEGRITVNGNLEINADKAIIARGYSITTINKNGDKTVKLNGDIDFTYNEVTSGTKVDATIDITLSGTDSYWVGNASTSTTSGTPPKGYSDVHGLKIKLRNQAQWMPTVVTATDTLHNIAINELKLDDGVISLSKELVEAGQAVRVESLSGTGGTINTHVDTQTDGTLVAGQVSVDKLENATSLKVVASNVTADDVTAESAGKTLELLGKLDDAADGSDQGGDIEHVGHQVTGGDLTVDQRQAARQNDHQIHQAVEQAGGGVESRHGVVAQRFDVLKVLVALLELGTLLLLGGKGFYHALTQQAVLDGGVQLTDLDALLPEPGTQTAVQINGYHAHQGHAGEHRQRQRDAGLAQDDEGGQDLDEGDEKFLGAVVGKLGHIEQIVGDAAHDGADLGVVVVGVVEQQQMVKGIPTHVGLDVHAHDVADAGHEILGRAVDDAEHKVDARQLEHDAGGQGDAHAHSRVGDGAHDLGQEDVTQCGQRGAEQVEKEHCLVLCQIG